MHVICRVRLPYHVNRENLQSVAGTVLGEPEFTGGAVGENALETPPEGDAVVWLIEMGELMGHDVLNDARREKDSAPVEVEGGGVAA